ncbi:CBS domain-containing protein [Nitrosomonas halophila]|uniref:IMP dehydrogenase/acetoin utilization protein AcuB n=1 Tax=Nitrosomonas halophila TaxID=44576 RepID=A0A1H3LTM0_9PROT|nr:CBS domain-containing protein [Nitrosomonas halophila]SDY67439.1 IMP dehydrogenase/acetoin utilization protein AcuB [Nitrosomonas halophila]
MTKIQALMTPMPKTIGFDISIEKAQAMMKEYGCRHLPVLNGGKLVGVLSDRDLLMARQGSKDGQNEQRVKDLMTDEPYVIDPSADIGTAIQEMLNHKINSLIVRAEGDQPWGILTSTDLLRHVIQRDLGAQTA